MDIQEQFDDVRETEEEAVNRILTCDESELKKGEYVEMGGVVIKGEKIKSKFWPIAWKIVKGLFKGLWWLIRKIIFIILRILKLDK